ncbi:hypothetical protein D3C87_1427310 [compost metagenome]
MPLLGASQREKVETTAEMPLLGAWRREQAETTAEMPLLGASRREQAEITAEMPLLGAWRREQAETTAEMPLLDMLPPRELPPGAPPLRQCQRANAAGRSEAPGGPACFNVRIHRDGRSADAAGSIPVWRGVQQISALNVGLPALCRCMACPIIRV